MTRLVINDIGPFVPAATLAQIRGYLGLDLAFKDLAELEAHLRLIHAGFGQLTDEQWQHLAAHSGRRTPEGLRLHYDPAIRCRLAAAAMPDIDLWELWDRDPLPDLRPARRAERAADRRRSWKRCSGAGRRSRSSPCRASATRRL